MGPARRPVTRTSRRTVPRRPSARPRRDDPCSLRVDCRARARDPPARHAHRRRCGRSSRASPARSGIYACGPTVYDRIHVGNARPFVVFSLLKRFLEHEGYDATLVVNVTDVNDKIYDAARAARASRAPSSRAR